MVRPIPTEVQNSINLLLIEGLSYSAIQKMYPNVGLSTLSRYKRKFLGDSTSPKARNLRNGSLNGPKGVQSYLLTLGIEMSLRDIRHELKSDGFKARRKVKTNFVNATNKGKCFAWAKKYQHYTVDGWHKWGFSDETRINMCGSDRKSYYWTDGDGGSVLFWGLITAEGSGYGSTITEGNVNTEVYIDILQTSLLDTLEYYGLDRKSFRFQQDNARPHTSVPTKQCPDLNPIEHVWNQLKRPLNAYPARATTIAELEARIHQEWYKFTKEDCLKYIDSMPNKIKAVIRSKGGPTGY
ncbi:hypothetical protein INT46_004216 [Mucor plumbeus]|uniref:Uncharacterized protein n=1 Tax=Mucor plumbeus TaxID=97098 RepID=A0A8H7QLV8_9FUNG|nr:hypothetical protein INT46_004216 [Mucor plumbeus]